MYSKVKQVREFTELDLVVGSYIKTDNVVEIKVSDIKRQFPKELWMWSMYNCVQQYITLHKY